MLFAETAGLGEVSFIDRTSTLNVLTAIFSWLLCWSAGVSTTKNGSLRASSRDCRFRLPALRLAQKKCGLEAKSLVIEGEEHEILHAERADSSRPRRDEPVEMPVDLCFFLTFFLIFY